MKDILSALQGEFRERGIPSLTQRDARIPAVTGKIPAVLGMRRSGKTYFLFQQIGELLGRGVPWESVFYLNFEDDRLLPVDRRKLAALLDACWALHPENHDREVHLFLDEIQNAEGWPVVLRRFLDTRRTRIVVTGSSSKLLGGEIATSLRGRSLPCEIWPFSFTERLRFLGRELPDPTSPAGPAARHRLAAELERYLSDGGFPETVPMDATERRETLRNYVDVAILRDVVERHSVANPTLVRYLIRTLIASAGSKFSVNKFYNDLRSQGIEASKNTIHTFLDHVEDAFLAFRVPIRTDSVRKRNVNPRKVYVADPALVRAFSFESGNLGARFENVVYLDLRRRGCAVAYHVTRSGYEIDFVARFPEGPVRLYQVAHDLSDAATLEREERALKEASEELGIEGMLVTPANYYSEFLATGS